MSAISREMVELALKQFAIGVLSDYGVDAEIPRNDPDFSDACFAEADAIWNVFAALEAQIAAADRLAEAGKRGLNFIENTESEMGGPLESGNALRAALAAYRATKEPRT